MTLEALGEKKRAAILEIAARHGVRRVRVFGSFARGDARTDSDLDLLIEACRTPPLVPGRTAGRPGRGVRTKSRCSRGDHARSTDSDARSSGGSSPVKDDRLYIDHVLECIARIDRYCQGGERAFRESELIQDAVLRNLQTLAASTQRIGQEIKELHPEVDWRAIAGFRMSVVSRLPRSQSGPCLGDYCEASAGLEIANASNQASDRCTRLRRAGGVHRAGAARSASRQLPGHLRMISSARFSATASASRYGHRSSVAGMVRPAVSKTVFNGGL